MFGYYIFLWYKNGRRSKRGFVMAKPTLVGFLIVAGIIGALALVPWALTVLILWGLELPIIPMVLFLLYGAWYAVVVFYLQIMSPGKGLSANFGG